MGVQSGQETGDQIGPDEEAAITVVIPAYRVGALVSEALTSVLGQQRADWRAIVVDDGDPDVTLHVGPFLTDPRIRLLQTDNAGVSVARNRAIAEANTPYIAFLDGDDVLEPDYCSVMIAALEMNPKAGFVTGDASYFGADRGGELFSAYNPQTMPATLERVLERRFNIFAAATVRREALASVGGFQAGLTTSEDFDLWLRLLIAGWELAYVPRPVAQYRRRAGSASRDSAGMLRTALAVTMTARDALAGRPEAIAAEHMCVRLTHEIAIAAAFDRLKLADRHAVRDAAKFLLAHGVAVRSPRLRAMLRLIRLLPACAPLMLALREKI